VPCRYPERGHADARRGNACVTAVWDRGRLRRVVGVAETTQRVAGRLCCTQLGGQRAVDDEQDGCELLVGTSRARVARHVDRRSMLTVHNDSAKLVLDNIARLLDTGHMNSQERTRDRATLLAWPHWIRVHHQIGGSVSAVVASTPRCLPARAERGLVVDLLAQRIDVVNADPEQTR
jgi:hypothetical protein